MSDPLGLASIFLACADTGGFSAAGRKLGMSRSSIGKAIGRLETHLGARLFHRTTRSQSLTADGHVYYERAQKAVAELKAARGMLESGRSEPAGVLKVTAPVVLGRRCVAPLFFKLAAVHPKLNLTMAFTDRPVDLIEEGYDLAVRIGGAANVAGLMGRRIGRQQMIICAAPHYFEGRGMPQSRSDLKDHDRLIYGRSGGGRPWRLPDGQGGVDNVESLGRIQLDNLEALADAATVGLGLAWLPSWLVQAQIDSGELVQILPREPCLSFDVWAMWPQGPYMPARLRAAVDCLVEGMIGNS